MARQPITWKAYFPNPDGSFTEYNDLTPEERAERATSLAARFIATYLHVEMPGVRFEIITGGPAEPVA